MTVKQKLQKVLFSLKTGDYTLLRPMLNPMTCCEIDQVRLNVLDPFINVIGKNKTLIATFDAERRPKEGEIIIIFGNYPHDYRNLITNNPIRRNLLDFWSFSFDIIESDKCWDDVDQIIIINMDERLDRYYLLLRDLARMGAPFNKIHRLSAQRGPADLDPALAGQLGCLQSHLGAVTLARQLECDNVLILEDDFSFTDDIKHNKDQISQFFETKYDYRICLLGTSKYGRTTILDELVMATFQPATNSEGYFCSKPGLLKLEECFSRSYVKLLATHDISKYATDRCWSEMQDGRTFLAFRDRIGLQAPSYSNIECRVDFYLD